MNTQKRYRAFGLYVGVIVILALLWLLKDSAAGLGQSDVYTYAQFENDLDAGKVESVVISQNREVPSGEAEVTREDKEETLQPYHFICLMLTRFRIQWKNMTLAVIL